MEEYKPGYISSLAQNKLNDCLSTFDFIKCNDIMEYLDWRWATLNGQIPDVDDLRYEANNMLMRAYKGFWENNTNDMYYYECGGLVASYCYYDDSDIKAEDKHCFNLRFVPVYSL